MDGGMKCKLLTRLDETRKKPMSLNTIIQRQMAFLVVLSLEYLPISSALSAAPDFCTTAQGGRSLSNDPFNLTESNVSNAIYTPGPCLKGHNMLNFFVVLFLKISETLKKLKVYESDISGRKQISTNGKSFLLGFLQSFILANKKKLAKISMHMHFNNLGLIIDENLSWE